MHGAATIGEETLSANHERGRPGRDARLSTDTTYQNEYFNENWTSRGVPTV